MASPSPPLMAVPGVCGDPPKGSKVTWGCSRFWVSKARPSARDLGAAVRRELGLKALGVEGFGGFNEEKWWEGLERERK
jgi:hypothetical protein